MTRLICHNIRQIEMRTEKKYWMQATKKQNDIVQLHIAYLLIAIAAYIHVMRTIRIVLFSDLSLHYTQNIWRSCVCGAVYDIINLCTLCVYMTVRFTCVKMNMRHLQRSCIRANWDVVAVGAVLQRPSVLIITVIANAFDLPYIPETRASTYHTFINNNFSYGMCNSRHD